MPFVSGDVVVKQLTSSTWELVETVVYQGREETFEVPAGFVTDFASVPRVFTWLLPRYGTYTRAAILHDWFCDTGVVSRADADGLFRRMMRELGVSVVRRWMMWAAVRAASHLRGASPQEVGWFALVAPPAVVFLAVPALVVQLWIVLFWLVELLAWVLRRTFTRTHVERPHLESRA
ncbi:DUF1353 domain-containing protein [Euzebya sp.]|uniref:DUF1353 domain-containing protein n=1 Tax=Euzebya sp. TaxID=1971409 RepID=UPI003514CBB9